MDEADLADGGDIKMRDAIVPQDLEQIGRRIGLDRIKRAARELLDEEAGGATRSMRTQQRDRVDRAELGDSGSPPAAG